MQRLIKTSTSALPLLLIGGLLYAALFVKAETASVALAPQAIARGDFLYGMSVPAPGLVWAAGSDGKLLRSEDHGKSWSLQASPVTVNLQDIAAWDRNAAVAVGNDRTVVVTGDGGKSWRHVEVPRSAVANKLLRVRIAGDGSAWATGEMGALLVSRDRGATWARAAEEQDLAWNDVAVQGRRIWLVGEFGRIQVSDDGGNNWREIASPVKSSLMAIRFRDDAHGVAVGVDGVVLRTSDGGAHWSEVPQVTHEHLFDVIWDGERWAAVGDKGVLLEGDVEADSWRASRVTPNDRSWHTKILRDGGSYLVAGSNFSVVDKIN
jgi:photosystem II stability/assembly factor-like uncharacterized protein